MVINDHCLLWTGTIILVACMYCYFTYCISLLLKVSQVVCTPSRCVFGGKSCGCLLSAGQYGHGGCCYHSIVVGHPNDHQTVLPLLLEHLLFLAIPMIHHHESSFSPLSQVVLDTGGLFMLEEYVSMDAANHVQLALLHVRIWIWVIFVMTR